MDRTSSFGTQRGTNRSAMPLTPAYPTSAHARAADAIVAFFADFPETEAVLLVNSCARGKATRDSCLDVKILVPEATDLSQLDARWQEHHATDPIYEALRQAGSF